MSNDLALFFGRFHPVLVHLPIGLLVLLAWLELISRWPRFQHANRGVGLVLAIAVPLAAGTALCGWLLSWEGGYDARLLRLHMWTGIGTAAATFLVTLLYWLDLQMLYRLTLFGTVGLLFVSSHFGGSLTHGSDYLVQYAPAPVRQALGLPPRIRKAPAVIPPAGESKEPQPAEPVFSSLIHPILDNSCVGCHGPEKTKGGLRLDAFESLMRGGDSGPAITAGKSSDSELVRRLLLPLDDDDHMPPDGKPQLSGDDITLIRWWIDEGADPVRTTTEAKPTPVVARIINGRIGAPAPAPSTAVASADDSAPIAQADIAPKAGTLGSALGLPLTFLGEKEAWLQANAGVLGPEFGDVELGQLVGVGKNLRWLDLSGTAITDAGLTNLAEMPNLSRLYLQRTRITDQGLKELTALQKLEYLNLYGTAVTDSGLGALERLPSLRQLYLWQTKVTPERAKAFATARVDQEQIKAWEKEIEALEARIRSQQMTVELGTTLQPVAAAPDPRAPINTACPVSGENVDKTKTIEYEGNVVAFCCDVCKGKFEADPKPFLEALKLKTPTASR